MRVREGTSGRNGQFIPALTTTCHGLLANILFYARNAGTFYFDLWKASDDGTDHVLFYTKELTVTADGRYSIEVADTDTVVIIPGLVFGYHCNAVDSCLLAVGNSVLYTGLTYTDRQDPALFRPGLLQFSQLTRAGDLNLILSLGIQVKPLREDSEGNLITFSY